LFQPQRELKKKRGVKVFSKDTNPRRGERPVDQLFGQKREGERNITQKGVTKKGHRHRWQRQEFKKEGEVQGSSRRR